jgi:hypothetical protein
MEIDMLTFNGKQYAKNKAELSNDCNGFYKKLKSGSVQIFNCNRELVALLHQDRFCVSASMHHGRAWYMFGLDEKTTQFLGFNLQGHLAEERTAFEAMAEA